MHTNQTLLITGGTGGLGAAVSTAVLDAGYAAVVVYRSPAEWQRLWESAQAAQDRLVGLQGDALSLEFMEFAVQSALERFSSLDGLLHLMGGYEYASFPDTDLERWQRMIQLNLTSAYIAAHAALPALEQSRGTMLFVGSQAAISQPAGSIAYNVAKAGLTALAGTLANELRSEGVRVNTVVPDIIDTAANRRSMPNANVERWLQPQQVAETLLYLLSDAASGVSGATITLRRT